jgi:hypothetical protein
VGAQEREYSGELSDIAPEVSGIPLRLGTVGLMAGRILFFDIIVSILACRSFSKRYGSFSAERYLPAA